MASTYYIDGKEKHVRICINSDKLVPPGQPFYCRSSEGVVNTHCCYEDYCNSIDLKVPGESWNHFIIFLFNQPDEFKWFTSVSLCLFFSLSSNQCVDRSRESLGSGGAGGDHRRASVSAVCAADGGCVPVAVPPESLQPQTEVRGWGPLLWPPVLGQGQDSARPHLWHVHLWVWLWSVHANDVVRWKVVIFKKKNGFLDKYPPIPVSRSSSVTVLL